MMYEGGHPDTPPTDWAKFRKGFSPYRLPIPALGCDRRSRAFSN